MNHKLRKILFLMSISYFNSFLFAGYIVDENHKPVQLAEPFEIYIPYTTSNSTSDYIKSTKEFNSNSSFVITNEYSLVAKGDRTFPSFPLKIGDTITGFEIFDTNNNPGYYYEHNALANLFETLTYGQYIIGTLSKVEQNTFFSFRPAGKTAVRGVVDIPVTGDSNMVQISNQEWRLKGYSFLIKNTSSVILPEDQNIPYFPNIQGGISTLKVRRQDADPNLTSALNILYENMPVNAYIKGTIQPYGPQTNLYFEVIVGKSQPTTNQPTPTTKQITSALKFFKAVHKNQ